MTLLNLPTEARWPRSLHSKADRLDALDPRGLEATRMLLLKSLRYLDALPLENAQTKLPED